MIEKDETTFEIEFDLSDIPKSERKAALNDVGDYLVEAVLDYVGQGKSPVAGVRDFKKLNAKYADAEKSGDRLPNLDLNGSMLDSLTFKVKGDKVIVGIFDEDEAIKSYNHNVGDTIPKRQFIPDDSKGQTLKKDIMVGVSRIIEEYFEEK